MSDAVSRQSTNLNNVIGGANLCLQRIERRLNRFDVASQGVDHIRAFLCREASVLLCDLSCLQDSNVKLCLSFHNSQSLWQQAK